MRTSAIDTQRQRPGTDEPILPAWKLERKINLVHMQPGKPKQNGCIKSCNGQLREECLHISLNYQTPAEFAQRRTEEKTLAAAAD